MAPVVYLPNGGALFSQEEIKCCAGVLVTIRKQYSETAREASRYADQKWSDLGWFGRLKSRLKQEAFWWSRQIEIEKPQEDKWGYSLWNDVGAPFYSSKSIAAEEIMQMSMCKRDCYLNPSQISVMEMTREFFNGDLM